MSNNWIRVKQKGNNRFIRVNVRSRHSDDKPNHAHTLENGDRKLTNSFGFDLGFEPVGELNVNDTVLSRSSIAITKPDSDSLHIFSSDGEGWEVIRHDDKRDQTNKYIYRAKSKTKHINREKGDYR